MLDRCTDASAEVARRPGVEVVEETAGSAGAARRRGAAHALTTSRWPPYGVWLASTDADSRVPPTWLRHHLELAAAGAELVLGTVTLGGEADIAPDLYRAWVAGYSRRDGHPHVHGANLGVRGTSIWRPADSRECAPMKTSRSPRR